MYQSLILRPNDIIMFKYLRNFRTCASRYLFPLDFHFIYDIINIVEVYNRVWRSLVARLNGVQEAAGSIPVTRTIWVSHRYYGLEVSV